VDGWKKLEDDPWYQCMFGVWSAANEESVKTGAGELPRIGSGPRSFGLVEQKLFEADFFLQEIKTRQANFLEVRFLFSAFCTSVRSVTFALQAVLSSHPGFAEWYEPWQHKLANDELARFFVACRNTMQKIGENPVSGGGRFSDGNVYCRFAPSIVFPKVPNEDVFTSCQRFLVLVIELVRDCHSVFKHVVDPQYYYTEDNFSRLGLTIEDAEQEIIGRPGWTEGVPLEERWRLLRAEVGSTGLEEFFSQYLG
jgi:hypothetical protein